MLHDSFNCQNLGIPRYLRLSRYKKCHMHAIGRKMHQTDDGKAETCHFHIFVKFQTIS